MLMLFSLSDVVPSFWWLRRELMLMVTISHLNIRNFLSLHYFFCSVASKQIFLIAGIYVPMDKIGPNIHWKFSKSIKKYKLESCLSWKDIREVDQKRLDFVWVVSSSNVMPEKSSSFYLTLLSWEHLGTSQLLLGHVKGRGILVIFVLGS